MTESQEFDAIQLAAQADPELCEQITAMFDGKTMLSTTVTLVGIIAFTACQGPEKEANEFIETMIKLLRETVKAHYSKKPEGTLIQ